ncbi:glucuronokinase 1-like isoform X2 [Camellia sinensis]|uniref:glucuronokinase 1-like isoform X2 n=1 Tax=Camellia sinensis TaxID=4442 RepID=UPI0010360B65|nr:glucuronokinase 1-like isoform X2 [Camellia sinensis]
MDPKTGGMARRESVIEHKVHARVYRLDNEGYYGGVRLLMAVCKVFHNYCKDNLIDLEGGNFTLSYDTNIPRQVRHLIKVEVRPNLVLDAEKELGIVAGLQDRVAQVYGGLVYMDFGKKYMDDLGHGMYTPMDINLLPPLHLIYAENPSDSGKVHSTVRKRWLDGDKFIISSMELVANIALEGQTALLEKNHTKFADLMNRNFDLRRAMFGDDALGALNIKMVETARSVGAAAKFTGSGGAVVAFCPNGPSQVKLLEDACQKVGFVIQPIEVVPSCLNEIELKTLSPQ